jgi:outer membrane protein assembly factor BamB
MSRSLLRCLYLSLSVFICGQLFAADWPQFLGPDRNGVSAETGLLQTWPKEGPPVVWQMDVGEGFSGPVVAGGSLVLFHRVGDKEVVQCLGAADGKEKWKFSSPTDYRDQLGKGDGPRATPVIAGDRVYTLGAAGKMHCLKLDNGDKVWERSLWSDYNSSLGYFGAGTSPIVEGDLVLVNVGGKGAGIVALNKDTGKEVWKATDDPSSYSSPVAATIDGVRSVIFFTRTGLQVLDPAKGTVRASLRWRAKIDASVNAATPLVLDGHVFLTASYGTGAILLKVKSDGVEKVWDGDETLSAQFNTPLRRGDYLYGFDGRQDYHESKLRCVEWKTGKVRWTQKGFGCGSAVLADGNLIILDEDGSLVLAETNPDGYKEKARARVLKGVCRAQIALADGHLYGRDDNKLVCWNLKK